MTLSKWLPTVAKRDFRSYEVEFHYLSQCTDSKYQWNMCLTEKKYMPKNRYSDILTYKHSRVVLKPRQSASQKFDSDEEFDPEFDSYINANFVDVSLYPFY